MADFAIREMKNDYARWTPPARAVVKMSTGAWKPFFFRRRGPGVPSQAFAAHDQLFTFGGMKVFIPTSIEAVRHVTLTNVENYIKPNAYWRRVGSIVGRSLFLAEGESWREMRKASTAEFTPRAALPVAKVTVERYKRDSDAHWPIGVAFDAAPSLKRLSIGVVAELLLSTEIDHWVDDLWRAVDALVATVGPSFADELFPLALYTIGDLRRISGRRRLSRIMREIVESRYRSNEDFNDLFSIYRKHESSSGGDQETVKRKLVQHVQTFLTAGALTTFDTLLWALYILARDTVAQDLVAQEARTLQLTPETAADDFGRLRMTLAVFKETLRLFPPVNAMGRFAVKDDLAAGTRIPRGTRVLIAPYVLGRHPEYWSDADAFDPTRFFEDRPEPNKFVYIPFGIGPRVCVGQFFATVESVTFLASLLRDYRLEIAEGDGREPKLGFGLRLNPAVRFRLTPRVAGDPASRDGSTMDRHLPTDSAPRTIRVGGVQNIRI